MHRRNWQRCLFVGQLDWKNNHLNTFYIDENGKETVSAFTPRSPELPLISEDSKVTHPEQLELHEEPEDCLGLAGLNRVVPRR